jgi:protein-S-isoprenylcysteine O-methyltransferase Ste14
MPLRREEMKFSAPKQITWIIALILGVVGILANLASIPVITPAIGFWLVVVGWLLLVIATITHGL